MHQQTYDSTLSNVVARILSVLLTKKSRVMLSGVVNLKNMLKRRCAWNIQCMDGHYNTCKALQ